MGAIPARSQASRPWGAPTGSESMASPRKATKTSAVKKPAKPDLLAVRAQIDGIDREIQSLIAERALFAHQVGTRSEEHTSELQSLMRISYAVFCLKKKKELTST